MNAPALQKLLLASRSTGTLNLSNKGLRAVPAEVLAPDSLDYDGKRWWEEAELTKLDLSHNLLTALPDALGSLGLQTFYACDNQLAAVPAALLDNPALTKLVLYQNRLTRLPPLDGAPALTELHVAQNQLASLPSLGALPALTSLNVSHNRLAALPSEGWGALRALRSLQASHNQLAQLPPGLAFLSALTDLDVSFNSLAALPQLQCPALTRLDAGHNHLPEADLRGLPRLSAAHLGNNRLVAFPRVPTPCPLTVLDLRDNRLTDVTEAAQLRQLKRLDLANNDLSTLPAELGLVKTITALELSGNPMRAIRRDVIARGTLAVLAYLRTRLDSDPEDVQPSVAACAPVIPYKGTLDLSQRGLQEVPLEVCDPSQEVTRLLLAGNRLAALTPELGHLRSLTHLDVNQNQLSALPLELGCLDRLHTLVCANNRLQGGAPPVLYHLGRLAVLDLRVNRLTALGDDFDRLPLLEELRLSHNQLAELPPSVYRLARLRILEAASNRLTEVDGAITRLTSLNVLDLSNNSLTRVPFELGTMGQLRQLSLQGNVLKALPRHVLDSPVDRLLQYLRQKIAP